jgi:hypothetical protein
MNDIQYAQLNAIKQDVRIVEVRQNSWEEENLLLLTTLTDEEIKSVLHPLLEEERVCKDGSVLYDNPTMVQILSEKYPTDIVILYGEPDDLEI